MRLLKKKLLFCLASEVDFMKKAEGYGYKGYDWLYFRLSEYEKGSVRDAANRLVKSGEVDKIVRNNRSLFRLTGVGRDKLIKSMRPQGQRKQVWDRIWRVVIVEGIGDDGRSLEVKLKRLGYKRVSRAVYVTPFKVSEETKSLFLEGKWQNKAQVIESRRLIVGDDLRLARTLWHLEEIGQKYADFVSLSDRLLKLSRQNISLLRQSKFGFKAVFDRYFSLLNRDPGLPRKLLPPDWQADKAKELFFRLAEMTKTAKI